MASRTGANHGTNDSRWDDDMPESTEVATVGTAAVGPTTGENINALVEKALDQGASVDTVERLVGLAERIHERNARMSMIDALAAFQAECPAIGKSRTARIKTRAGGSYSYSYAPLEEIARVIRPLLRRHGLAYTWDTRVVDGLIETTCILTHVDGHEVRASFSAPTDTKAEMSGAQAAAAANTYAKRQSLVSVLGLTTTDEDTDGAMRRDRASEPVTTDQVTAMQDKIKEVGADRDKFLAYLGVPSLESLPSHRYAEAMKALDRKKGAA